MNKNSFFDYIRHNIKNFLPSNFVDSEIEIRSIVKGNDQNLTGLYIKNSLDPGTPAIYLDSYYQDYQNQ